MLVQDFQCNAKTRFTSRVNFVENNEIITASHIQKFGNRMTMNELLTSNGLTILSQGKTVLLDSVQEFKMFIQSSFLIFLVLFMLL